MKSITASGKDYYECPVCGTEIGDQEEFRLHKNECHGYTDPKDRFEVGDRVTHSDFGEARLKNRYNKHLFPREGEIVGFGTARSHSEHCVRVRWDGNKTARKYAHTFIKHAD